MAVPGSPLDPRAQGCNKLIRDGAILIQNAETLPETIRPFDLARAPGSRGVDYGERMPADGGRQSEAERQMLLELLSPTPVAVEDIIRQSE
jgi:DNA processing protein